ncbi:MAG: tRNA-dihydrouridine synthase [Phycisphaerales bacterium]|nr:tRNA-dihydrouridine synthase [Phycisphaerales bacterium]
MIGVPLQIGPVPLESNLLLAPIAGWCDLAWRVTVRSLGGVGLACTDLLSPQGLLRGSEASLDIARTNDFDRPIGMQLYGSDPAIMADGAKWAADHGATVVDINMGCPVDKVTKKDGGSKLMCCIPGAVAIAEAVRAALPEEVPLTAKMRLGWDEQAYEAGCACELAVRLAQVGVAMVTVHGRTTEQRFKGDCRHEGIRRVVEAVGEATGSPASGGVPVIGNGDVRSAEDCLAMMRATGCAGVMIGRGAFARPWVFQEAWGLQRSIAEGVPLPGDLEPSEAEKIGIARAYFERMREYRDDRYALHKFRQKISWLGKSINGGHCRALKEGVRNAQNPEEIHAALDAWLAGAPEPTPAG